MTGKRPTHITGNCGLHHTAWQLSKRGWTVTATARNSAGADLFAANPDETQILAVQCKAMSNNPLHIRLHRDDPAMAKTPWWAITLKCYAADPVTYVFPLAWLQANAKPSGKTGWVVPVSAWRKPEFIDAWPAMRAGA